MDGYYLNAPPPPSFWMFLGWGGALIPSIKYLVLSTSMPGAECSWQDTYDLAALYSLILNSERKESMASLLLLGQ